MPNIKLKGQTGEVLTYEDVERVYFDSADKDGEVVYYTYGKIVEGVTIEPNFAKGDQVISVPDGSLVKEATIVKPAALVPENIRAGAMVAGVTGDFLGDTEELTVDLDMGNGGQTITPSTANKVMSKVVVTKPGTMVPENIRAGVNIGGVVGEYVTPGTTKEIEPDFSEGDQTVTAEGDERWNEVIVKMPETLIPENIVKDVDIGGVVGTFEGGGGGGIGNGAYNVKVIDYDGRLLAEKNLDNGEVFELPNAPTHKGLVFDGWSAPIAITDNTLTVPKGDITVGPMYHTASGATEIDIILTKVTGLTFTFYSSNGTSRMTGMTSIDWGDGTTTDSSVFEHTYSDYGQYTIKIYGMTAIAGGTATYGITTANSIIREVRFASGVTSIGSYAFNNNKALTYVALPYGLSSIGSYVFQNCYSLCSITIPSSGSTYNGLIYCFSGCYSLAHAVLSPNLLTIGNYAFSNCFSLKRITLSCTSLTGKNAFYKCQSLSKVISLKSLSQIADQVFNTCEALKILDFTANTSVPTLTNTALQAGNDGRQILVSASLYDTWIASTYWSTFKDYVVAV